MSFREHLGWHVPQEPWKVHEGTVLNRYGATDLYVGVEAERIYLLWREIEEMDRSVLDLPTGDPIHTQKTNESDTPLPDQEKEYVQVAFHPDLKESISGYADQYGVNQGVLLGYILREYYETDGWGYSIEAVGSPTPDSEGRVDEIPTSRREKKDLICERISATTNPDGNLHVDTLHETIGEIAGETVVDDYLPDILDRLGFVHHPYTNLLFIHESRLEDLGVSPTAPSIERKPYSALNRQEKIKGIKETLKCTGAGMTVSEIHTELFDGNGSDSHIRQLVHAVAEANSFVYRETPGGSKVLRAVGVSRSASPDPESEPEVEAEVESAPFEDVDRQRRETVESEAAAEMDALMNAAATLDGEQAATDGGADQPE